MNATSPNQVILNGSLVTSYSFSPIIALHGASYASPATMLLVTRKESNSIATLSFDSMAAREATAQHISQVRSPRSSTLEMIGAWKANFIADGDYVDLEPKISMLCIPSPNEFSIHPASQRATIYIEISIDDLIFES